MSEEAFSLSKEMTNQNSLEDLTVVSTTKLDADEYAAEDIDGVTESLSGSGNMGYASLQASQTDEALRDGSAIDYQSDTTGNVDGNNAYVGEQSSSAFDDASGSSTNVAQKKGSISVDTDRPLDNALQDTDAGVSGSGGQFNSTAGSVSASQLSSDAGNFSPSGSGIRLDDGLNDVADEASSPENATNSAPSSQNSESTNAATLARGDDVKQGDIAQHTQSDVAGGMNIDVDIEININNAGDTINDTLIELGDVITVVTANITNITQHLTHTVNQSHLMSYETVDHVTTLVHQVTDVLQSTINQTIDVVSNATNTVVNNVSSTLVDVSNVSIDTITSLSDILELLQDLPAADSLEAVVESLIDATNILQDVVESTVITVADAVPDTIGVDVLQTAFEGLGDAINILQPILGETQTQIDAVSSELVQDVIHHADTHIPDNILNAVADHVHDLVDAAGKTLQDVKSEAVGDVLNVTNEALDIIAPLASNISDATHGATNQLLTPDSDNTQDSDITADAGLDVLDVSVADVAAEAIIDPVEDVLGDVDIDTSATMDVLGDNNTDNEAGDNDLTVTPNIDVADVDIADSTVDVNLDPVEAITGDIDVNNETAVNLLGEQADGTVNDAPGGSGDGTFLNHVGDGLQHVADEVIADNVGLSDNHDNVDSDITADAGIDVLDVSVADVAAEAIIDPVEDVLGDVDIDTSATTDVFGDNNTDNEAGDNDLTVTPNIDVADVDIADSTVDVNLDPVEAITGDIDVNNETAVNLLGEQADGTVNDAPGGTGDDTLLDYVGEALNHVADEVISEEHHAENDTHDSDLLVNGDIDIAGHDVVEIEADISLDLIESLVGDIDLHVTGDIALLDTEADGTDIANAEIGAAWTETTVIDGGGMFGDMVNGAIHDELPDPSGTVAEGLGALHIDPDIGSGSGGLLG